MKKIHLLFLAIFAVFAFANPVLAADGAYGVQIDVSSTSIDSSSAPAAGVDVNAGGHPGVGFRFIGPISGYQNIEYTVGASKQNYNVKMAGADLQSGPSSTSLFGTVRYRFSDNEHFKPYIGAGLHNTSFDQATLAAGVLTMDSTSISGLVAEIGVRMPVPELVKGFYVDLNASRYFGSANARMATGPAYGNVPVTTVSMGNPTKATIALGFNF